MLMNLIVSYNLVDLHFIDFCQAFIVEAVSRNRSLINSGLKNQLKYPQISQNGEMRLSLLLYLFLVWTIITRFHTTTA